MISQNFVTFFNSVSKFFDSKQNPQFINSEISLFCLIEKNI
jgi:hypothetical protein